MLEYPVFKDGKYNYNMNEKNKYQESGSFRVLFTLNEGYYCGTIAHDGTLKNKRKKTETNQSARHFMCAHTTIPRKSMKRGLAKPRMKVLARREERRLTAAQPERRGRVENRISRCRNIQQPGVSYSLRVFTRVRPTNYPFYFLPCSFYPVMDLVIPRVRSYKALIWKISDIICLFNPQSILLPGRDEKAFSMCQW